jgi:hypothetical protein
METIASTATTTGDVAILPTRDDTPVPGATETLPPLEVAHETIMYTSTRSITLASGELIVGTADRWQGATGEPPCTAFVIRGPIAMELTIYYGGWDKWVNVYDEQLVEGLLNKKIDELKRHPTCPKRGPTNIVKIP